MRYRKQLWMLPVVTLAAVLGGCLPVELSVSPDGDVLIPRTEGFVVYKPADGSVNVVHKPERGQAVFAVYAPNGGRALLIEQVGNGDASRSFRGLLIDADGGTKHLFSHSNITYAQWSPDGRYVSITRVADRKVEPIDQNLPELILVDVADGGTKTLASNVSAIHRWMPDGRGIVVFQMESNVGDSDYYAGKLVTIDVATGEQSAVVGMAGEHGAFFDVSPDGTAAMVIAAGIDSADADMSGTAEAASKLYAVNMTSGEHREVAADAAFAVYSPDGDKVLIGSAEEQDGMINLSVAHADGSAMSGIAADAAQQADGGSSEANIYPTWLDDQRVLYLSRHAVYGTAGANLMLTSVNADGTAKTIHQGRLDAALTAD